MDTNATAPAPPIVVFDVSYLIFYRIYAMRAWYKHSQREWDEDALVGDAEFMGLLKAKMRDCVSLCLGRHGSEQAPTIFCVDGQHSTAWRRSIYPEYKSNRQLGAAYRTMFANALQEIREYCGESPHRHLFEKDELEADDIAHAFTAKLRSAEATRGRPIVIVASDHDYLPLLVHADVRIENAKGVQLALPKHIATPAMALPMKIVIGDKSDCIPPIAPRIGKKIATALLDNGGARLAEKLDAHADWKANYERNRQLVDNTCLPAEHLEWLSEQFAGLLTAMEGT